MTPSNKIYAPNVYLFAFHLCDALESESNSAVEFTITRAMRIAQMIIAKTERAELLVVHQLNESQRGVGGFGHTGIE